MKKLFISSVACILIISCSKKTNDKDYEAPVVTLTSPANNQVFTAGEMINIQGTVTDNQYISQVHVEITDHNTGVEYLHIHIHPTSKTYAYNQAFTAQAGINYTIRVIADDPSANTFTKQVEVSCN